MIGTHIDSDPVNILSEANKIKKYNGNIIQLFVQLMSKKVSEEQYLLLKHFLIENKMKCVVHISYTINCSQNWDFYSWWIKQFIMEIQIANKIGAFAVVVHLGKQLKLTKEESLNNMYSSLLYIHNQTKDTNIKILIETSTGQGSEICYELESLAYFYKKFSEHKNISIKNRFGICLDTCHIFAAGNDIRTIEGVDIFFAKFDKLIGLKHIKLIHLNDSKSVLNSNLDRHANIGKGHIGKESLIYISKYFISLGVPIILETPTDKHKKEIKMLTK
jgi:deoxyribonuclease-4